MLIKECFTDVASHHGWLAYKLLHNQSDPPLQFFKFNFIFGVLVFNSNGYEHMVMSVTICDVSELAYHT